MDALPAKPFSDVLEEARAELTCDELLGGAAPTVSVQRLRDAGLRPTHQRVMLGELLFARGDRHVTAEMLYGEAVEANIHLSMATV